MKTAFALLFCAVTSAALVAVDETKTILAGGKFDFSSTTTGLPVPTKQWMKDGAPIVGATTDKYSVPVVATAHAGAYSLVVTNKAGSSESNIIAIAVATPAPIAPPAITKNPSDLSVPKKGDAKFSVEATGPDLRYQWRKGSTNIVGATSASYTVVRAMPDSKGTYTVEVWNAGGRVISKGAVLTITR